MAEFIQAITDEQFENKVIHSAVPVLVDFWAEWCGPCKMLTPILEEMIEEYQGRVTFFKLNIDEHMKVAAQFGVQSIPYLILFKDGKAVATEVGLKTKSQLSSFLDKYI